MFAFYLVFFTTKKFTSSSNVCAAIDIVAVVPITHQAGGLVHDW